MNKWRPFNWEDYQVIVDGEVPPLFEAGADAMLEAIWELAKQSPTKAFTFDANIIQILEQK